MAVYGVSRATVREALRRLLADDLVQLLAHRGVRVRRLSLSDLHEIYTLWEVIEGLAARLAAQLPREATAELWEIHEKLVAAVAARDRVRFLRLNAYFHSALARITGNRLLVATQERLNAQLIGFQFMSAMDSVRLESSERHHGEVLSAIASGDPDAAETAMRRHIQVGRQAILAAAEANTRRDGRPSRAAIEAGVAG